MSGTKIPCPGPRNRAEGEGELSGDDDGCCWVSVAEGDDLRCSCGNAPVESGPELLRGLPGDGGLRPDGFRDGLGPDAIPCCPKTSAIANRCASGSLARATEARIASSAVESACRLLIAELPGLGTALASAHAHRPLLDVSFRTSSRYCPYRGRFRQ